MFSLLKSNGEIVHLDYLWMCFGEITGNFQGFGQLCFLGGSKFQIGIPMCAVTSKRDGFTRVTWARRRWLKTPKGGYITSSSWREDAETSSQQKSRGSLRTTYVWRTWCELLCVQVVRTHGQFKGTELISPLRQCDVSTLCERGLGTFPQATVCGYRHTNHGGLVAIDSV